MKPIICKENDINVSLPEECEIYDWLIPVEDVDEIKKPDRYHAYITPDKKVYVLDKEGKGLVVLEENHIEQITKNGEALEIVDKKVNIDIPTKTSDLINNTDFVSDANYVHTDTNYTSLEKQKLGNIEDDAQVNILNWIKRNGLYLPIHDKSVDIQVPENVSELENNAGYITKIVDDLMNYYNKSETYTRIEVNQMINAIDTLKFEIVVALPTENISETTIYLVEKHGSVNDAYDEFIYISNTWEKIGSTDVDLTNYYTKEQIENNYINIRDKGVGIASLDSNQRVEQIANNALQFNGQLPPYYLNYNNLTNTPMSLPNPNMLKINNALGEETTYNGSAAVTVTLNKENIGLNNVDNTSDMDKPVSTLQQNAIRGKADTMELVNDTLSLKSATNVLSDVDLSTINKGDKLALNGSTLSLKNTSNNHTLDSVELPTGVQNQVISGGDFNTIKEPGFYTMRLPVANIPDGRANGGYWGLMVVKSDTGASYFQQIATLENTNRMWVRHGTSTWKEYGVVAGDSLSIDGNRLSLNNKSTAISTVSLPTVESMPIGSIIAWGGTSAPTGFLLCQGQLVSKTSYADLWNVIGNNFLNGRTAQTSNFYLPDMRGNVPVGKSTTPSTDEFYTLGKILGAKTHTLSVSQIPSHNHNYFNTPDNLGTYTVWVPTTSAHTKASYQTNMSNTGGGQAHNNIQPSLVTNYIIKYAYTSYMAPTRAVIDNLEATSAMATLSANQEKILNEKVDTDYVVETNHNSTWFWRKWKSGFVELYGRDISRQYAVTENWGTLMTSAKKTNNSLRYPFTLTKCFSINCMPSSSIRGTDGLFMNENTSNDDSDLVETGIWSYVRSTAETSAIQAKYTVYGLWK